MMLFFTNPYDQVSVNTLQYLFVNGVTPLSVPRTSYADDKGFWISFLPTLLLCSDDYKTEYCRIEDYTKITPDSARWMLSQWQANIMQGKPIDKTAPPAGVIIK